MEQNTTSLSIGVSTPSPLTQNASQVVSRRYSIKNEKGEAKESWNDIVLRVVHHVAEAELDPYKKAEFFNEVGSLMRERKFIPNTPCLVNAGRTNAQLAACFVLPVEDSIRGIMKTASDAALIHQSGGGTGFSFEKLRPTGAIVKSTHGIASGPISFMEIFDKVTDVVKQGGVRRGANMGIMRCDHPDILRFIHAKNNQDKLTNFNISVSITDEFMKAVFAEDYEEQFIQARFDGKPWSQPIYDPLDKVKGFKSDAGQLHAPTIWLRIIESAHKYAEPGVIFIDTVNRTNLLRESMGDIIASNPCAEQMLHSNNSCNLGSIDVSKFYGDEYNTINWQEFKNAIHWSVRFLDNVIDTCDWPLPEVADVVSRTRPVGLGIMGFADLLLKMEIRYGSQESLDFLSNLMGFFQVEAWRASCNLGEEKGAFPEYYKNKKAYDEFLYDLSYGLKTPRNYEVTTIAPTGTISLVAECSSGIEPNFAWSYHRADTVGERDYIHPIAEKYVRPADVMETFVPKLPDYFVTAHDVTPEQHVRVLATAQKYVDNSVSKTCNGHENDTVDSVKELYELAYSLGVKAVSYYRDGSRDNQVLTKHKETKKLCEDCNEPLQEFDGCSTCFNCGKGSCTL